MRCIAPFANMTIVVIIRLQACMRNVDTFAFSCTTSVLASSNDRASIVHLKLRHTYECEHMRQLHGTKRFFCTMLLCISLKPSCWAASTSCMGMISTYMSRTPVHVMHFTCARIVMRVLGCLKHEGGAQSCGASLDILRHHRQCPHLHFSCRVHPTPSFSNKIRLRSRSLSSR